MVSDKDVLNAHTGIGYSSALNFFGFTTSIYADCDVWSFIILTIILD